MSWQHIRVQKRCAQHFDLSKQNIVTTQRQGALTSTLGLLARIVGSDHAALRESVIQRLNEQLLAAARVDDGAAEIEQGDRIKRARAAATALHLTRDPFAARLLAASLPDLIKPEVLTQVGEVTTTAGFLGGESSIALRTDEPDESDCPADTPEAWTPDECSDELVRIRGELEDFLYEVAKDPLQSESNRGAACSGLGLIGSPAARSYAELLTAEFAQESNPAWARLGACLSHMPTAMTTNSRELLRNV